MIIIPTSCRMHKLTRKNIMIIGTSLLMYYVWLVVLVNFNCFSELLSIVSTLGLVMIVMS